MSSHPGLFLTRARLPPIRLPVRGPSTPKHRWRFFRAGGFDQVRLDTGADIASLDQLDPKLWVALSCPTRGLDLDGHTLDILDGDMDGRIRLADVLSATKWTTGLLKNSDELTRGAAALPLASIDESTPEGKNIVASAREILKNLGKPDALDIAPGDTQDTVKIFAKTLFNGDGIVPPEAAETDVLTLGAIKDIIKCLGADKDKSGLDGVSREKVDQFFSQGTAYVEWWKKAESDPEVLPLLDRTQAAYAAWDFIRPRVDDFFSRCALAAMDPHAASEMKPSTQTYEAIATADPDTAAGMLQKLALARVEPSRSLPLDEGINPVWVDAVRNFKLQCVIPLIGDRTVLTREEWRALSARFAAHQAWLRTKPAQAVEPLGIARLKDLCDGKIRQSIEALIARDAALETHAKAITSVDRLAHLYRDLYSFLNNFVAFRDFYTKKAKAVFQAGTLYLDGRSCELCIRVDDANRHSVLATHSMMFLAYCECQRKGGSEKLTIAAAFTGGDSHFLLAGRNGLFIDRKGVEWDATITKVIEQPISMRQAFWAPYLRLGKLVSDQVEKLAGAKEKASSEGVGAKVLAIGAPPPAGAPATPAVPFDIARYAGIFAAIGLALGAIGTALAAVVTGFLDLKWWQMPLAIFGIVLVVSGPAVVMAAAKLRRRNLGPLLDASGWAINARAMINIPFGGSLTQLAHLPAGAERSLTDPYADRRTAWWVWLVLVLMVSGGITALVLSGWLHALRLALFG